MTDISNILLAYGIPSIQKRELVEQAINEEQRQRLLDAKARDDIYRVLAEVAEVAKQEGKAYVHP